MSEQTASITIHFNLRGYPTELTVYGTTGAELLKKAGPAIDGLEKMGAAPTVASSGGNGNGNAANAPVCEYHGAMKRSTKFAGWYCPSKMGDGSYCKSQVKD